jgi:ABC-type transport system substrate-binding protein
VDWAYNANARAPTYDPTAARRLIAAGVERDFVATLLCTTLGSGVGMAKEIAGQLMAVGLYVQPRCVPPQDYFALLFDKRDFDLAVMAGSQGPDPDSLTTRFSSHGGSQVMGYANAELDEILARGGSSPDISVRTASYFKAQEILARDLPIAPLVENVRVTVSRVGVSGLPQDDARGLVPEFMYNLIRLSPQHDASR